MSGSPERACPPPHSPTEANAQATTRPVSIQLMGMPLAVLTEAGLLEELFSRLAHGRGGWLITANLDFLRRYHLDARARVLYDKADLRVADGMPLVWAAQLQGTPLPERVAGSSLLYPLAERAAREGRSIYFLGGDGDAAERCAETLMRRSPALRVAGHSSPRVPLDPNEDQVAPLRDELLSRTPDIVLVALGSPKQEQLIDRLRGHLPRSWFIGVGASFGFVAGSLSRAPSWMQRTGLEWIHRLAHEPKRLAKRYLVHDAPFALKLLAHAGLQRWRGS